MLKRGMTVNRLIRSLSEKCSSVCLALLCLMKYLCWSRIVLMGVSFINVNDSVPGWAGALVSVRFSLHLCSEQISAHCRYCSTFIISIKHITATLKQFLMKEIQCYKASYFTAHLNLQDSPEKSHVLAPWRD